MLWVDVLNRAIEWNGPGAQARGQHPQAGMELDAPLRAALDDDVWLLRRVFAARLFAAGLDGSESERLSQWLAAVTLRPAVLSRQAATPVAGLVWPALLARRASGGRCEPFETLLSTALVQLVALPADWLGSMVQRCHGLRRGPAPANGWPELDAPRFAAAAGVAAFVDGAGMHQCPRLVWSRRGGRYCSKACSNASFAARKARREPGYFAAKQDRYRARRQRLLRGRVRRSAFVYMD